MISLKNTFHIKRFKSLNKTFQLKKINSIDLKLRYLFYYLGRKNEHDNFGSENRKNQGGLSVKKVLPEFPNTVLDHLIVPADALNHIEKAISGSVSLKFNKKGKPGAAFSDEHSHNKYQKLAIEVSDDFLPIPLGAVKLRDLFNNSVTDK